MSINNNDSDHTNGLSKEVKSSQQNNDPKEATEKTGATFDFKNNRIALIYHDDFFLKVYKGVFEQYGLEVILFKEIDTESMAKISEMDPLVVVVIDDYLGKQVDYSSQIAGKIKHFEKAKNIPVVLTSDRPPSEVAEDILKIYSLSQNQT